MVVHRRHKLSLFRKLKIACFGILFTILDIFMLSIKALFLPNSITAVCCLGLAIYQYFLILTLVPFLNQARAHNHLSGSL